MPCRVGITTDPKRRKQEWEEKVYGLSNWELSGPYSSREAAQNEENKLKAKYNCEGAPGEKDADDDWHVYMFNYASDKP